MSYFFAGFIASLFVVFIVLLGVGAIYLRYKKMEKEGEYPEHTPYVPKTLQKEERLESANPADLITDSPRADDLARRSDELADTVRQRIRDRAKQVVSGKSDIGASGNS